MAEPVIFDLRLIDNVSRSAARAASAVRQVETQSKKAQAALDFSKELGRSQAALSKLKADPAGFKKLLETQRALREEREKLKKAASGGGEGFFASFKKALPFRSLNDYVKGAFYGELLAHGVMKAGEFLVESARKAAELFADGVKALGREEQRRSGYALTLGEKGGAAARADVEKFKGVTAFSGSQNQDLMLPLYRAGLKGQAARSAYAAALDLAAGRGKGADTEAVAEGVDLFAKIQQKGGVTSKQLAGVGLGEMNLPSFYKSLGKKLGVSAESAEKMAAQPGGVDPQLLANLIQDAIEKQQGGKLGTGGARASKSLFGVLNKLKELPEDFFEGLADSPALPRITKAISGFVEKLDPESPLGKRIFAGLETAFGKLADVVEYALKPETIDAFVGFLAKIPGYINAAITAAEVFAAIWAGKKIVDSITAITLGITTMSAPLLAVLGAATATAAAFTAISTAVDELGGAKAVGRDLWDFISDPMKAQVPQGGADADFDKHTTRALKPAPAGERSQPSQPTVQQVNHIKVDLRASGDDDVAHRRAARRVAKHTQAELERAVAEAGGG